MNSCLLFCFNIFITKFLYIPFPSKNGHRLYVNIFFFLSDILVYFGLQHSATLIRLKIHFLCAETFDVILLIRILILFYIYIKHKHQ